jgi:cytochrome c oxidase cbb3-type subunit 3
MTAKFLLIFAFVAFGLTSRSQLTNYPDSNDADSSAFSTMSTNASAANPLAISGRKLFLKNCAHCHGADAHGDDGPDLHDLGLTDKWIANRIRKGKAGEMTSFAGKLKPEEIDALVAYVQSLK